MAVVQGPDRAIGHGGEAGDAAIAAVDLLTPGRVHRAVAHDQKIAAQGVKVLGHDLREVRRALLLLALVEQLDVDGGRDVRRPSTRRGR